MPRFNRCWGVLAVVCSVALIVLLVFSRTAPLLRIYTSSHDGYRVGATGSHPEEAVSYLYHVQTAECLSDYYLGEDVLGNAEACSCHVIVSSYTKLCTRNNYTHVTYVDGKGTTWTTGRNRLHRCAKSLPNYDSYLYHIFIDNDLIFVRTQPEVLSTETLATLNATYHQAPLRLFETFLANVRPAVGTAVSCCGMKVFIKSYFLRDCCGSAALTQLSLPEFYPMVNYDEMFIAYHRLALSHLFPLPTNYEKESWWMSNIQMMLRIYVKYRGQSIRYTPVKVLNSVHSSYPQHNTAGYKELLSIERANAPEFLRNNSVWDDTLFVGRSEPSFFPLIKPPFKMVPYKENPSMEPYFGITHPSVGIDVKPMVLKPLAKTRRG